jgi:hypothetical protein
MHPIESGFTRSTAREFAVLAVAALGAYLFFIHGALYLQPGSSSRPVTLEGFLLVTALLYLLLRLTFVVAGFYLPPAQPKYVVCPECGEKQDEAHPVEVAWRRRVPASAKPSDKEVLAAVMLRKAIDDARRTAQKNLSGPKTGGLLLPGEAENPPLSYEEFERILRDLDSKRFGRDDSNRRPSPPVNR